MKLIFIPQPSINHEKYAALARLYSTDSQAESGAVVLDTETYSQTHSEPEEDSLQSEEEEEAPIKPVIKTSPTKQAPETATMRNSGSYYRKSSLADLGESSWVEILGKYQIVASLDERFFRGIMIIWFDHLKIVLTNIY